MKDRSGILCETRDDDCDKRSNPLRQSREAHDSSGACMSEERPKQTASGASVLLVGLTPDVLVHVSAFVAPHGIKARATTLVKLHQDTAQFKPIVVLVDAYLYDFDTNAFDKLAREIGAKLGVVSGAKEAEKVLATMLFAPTTTIDPNANDGPKSAPGKQGFDTAKYDKKTIEDALERMGTKRPEFTTAKYDKKTLDEALERMNPKRSDQDTGKYDAAALIEAIKRSDEP